ncbi:hypothetical protein ACS0TY_029641 [Phlomoides rotata]
MTNGSEGSQSVPPTSNPPITDESPRRDSEGDNAALSSPRGRGSPSPSPPVMGVPGRSAFTRYTRPPPAMGVPGQSAFTRYTRPPPPPPHVVSPGGGFSGEFGAQGVVVGGSGAAAPGVRIGGSPVARKRVREGRGGNSPPAEGAPNRVYCSVCGKMFPTHKALFGHMRSHPERGWRGAHPPPAFRAEEEFLDLHIDRIEVENAAAAAPAPREAEVVQGGEEGQSYGLPDLNNPPPEDSS